MLAPPLMQLPVVLVIINTFVCVLVVYKQQRERLCLLKHIGVGTRGAPGARAPPPLPPKFSVCSIYVLYYKVIITHCAPPPNQKVFPTQQLPG